MFPRLFLSSHKPTLPPRLGLFSFSFGVPRYKAGAGETEAVEDLDQRRPPP